MYSSTYQARTTRTAYEYQVSILFLWRHTSPYLYNTTHVTLRILYFFMFVLVMVKGG